MFNFPPCFVYPELLSCHPLDFCCYWAVVLTTDTDITAFLYAHLHRYKDYRTGTRRSLSHLSLSLRWENASHNMKIDKIWINILFYFSVLFSGEKVCHQAAITWKQGSKNQGQRPTRSMSPYSGNIAGQQCILVVVGFLILEQKGKPQPSLFLSSGYVAQIKENSCLFVLHRQPSVITKDHLSSGEIPIPYTSPEVLAFGGICGMVWWWKSWLVHVTSPVRC